MRAIAIRRQCPLIIAPFRAVLHNRTEQDQLACLRQVRDHLRPDGRFASNVFTRRSNSCRGTPARLPTCMAPCCRGRARGRRLPRASESAVATRPGNWRTRSTSTTSATIRTDSRQVVPASPAACESVSDRSCGNSCSRRASSRFDIAGGFDGHAFERKTDELRDRSQNRVRIGAAQRPALAGGVATRRRQRPGIRRAAASSRAGHAGADASIVDRVIGTPRGSCRSGTPRRPSNRSSSRSVASRTGTPIAAPISNRNSRVMPGSRPASSGGVSADAVPDDKQVGHGALGQLAAIVPHHRLRTRRAGAPPASPARCSSGCCDLIIGFTDAG